MTTGIAVDGEIELWFAIGDEPAVEGADETESKEDDGWLKKKYRLKAQNLVIKGKVTKLYCSYNTLSSLDVSKNTKLTELYCNNNTLSSLDVSRNTKLTVLYCSNNSLTSLDVSGSTGLTELFCDQNSLASLDVRNNTKLKELFCHNNSLNGESLELPALANEGILYFKYGAEDAQMLTEDEVEDIRENKKWAVKTHDSGDWDDYAGEERAIAMTTGIAVDGEIELWFAIGDEPAVEGAEVRESKEDDGWLKKKYTLKAQNLVIKGKVTKLECSYNSLTSLDVRKNTKLEILYCNNNTLTSLDVSKNTKLTELYCANNTLASLDVRKNTKLTELYCANTFLTSLDVSKNTKLTELYCNNNTLTSLDVRKNTGLTLLSCDNNSLKSLDVRKNTELTVLSCSRNNSLKSLDVSGNAKLTELYCDNNSLKSLDVSSNTKLTTLYCYKNKLTFGELKLPELSAKGNLYFKDTSEGDLQTLTKAQVEEIEKNWKVYQYKGSSWVEYPGE